MESKKNTSGKDATALLSCCCESRLDGLEEKIDACLVLLRTVTTSDEFHYTLNNKSPLWARAIRGAEVVVSRVVDRVAAIHQEYERVTNRPMRAREGTSPRASAVTSPPL